MHTLLIKVEKKKIYYSWDCYSRYPSRKNYARSRRKMKIGIKIPTEKNIGQWSVFSRESEKKCMLHWLLFCQFLSTSTQA